MRSDVHWQQEYVSDESGMVCKEVVVAYHCVFLKQQPRGRGGAV